MRGTIGRKLGFYTFFSDTQSIYPEYIQQYGQTYGQPIDANGTLQPTAPGESFIKEFGTRGVDFLSARGYITFNALKVINVQFGHDRNSSGMGFVRCFYRIIVPLFVPEAINPSGEANSVHQFIYIATEYAGAFTDGRKANTAKVCGYASPEY